MNTNKFHRNVIERMFYRAWLRGEGVRCNICLSNFKRFLHQGAKYKNVECPKCGSDESVRILWFYLTNEVFGQKNKNRFLWFSPLEFMEKKKLAMSPIPEVANSAYFFNDKERLPGGVFDVIVFSHQLQYLQNDEQVLGELRRLLRTGGFVLIQTIVNPEMDRTYEQINTDDDRDRLKYYFEPGMRSMYGQNFHKHLARAGFDVEIINYADRLGDGAIQYYQLGRSYRSTIYKCKKP